PRRPTRRATEVPHAPNVGARAPFVGAQAIRCSLSRFVDSPAPSGMPIVMTTMSPGLAIPPDFSSADKIATIDSSDGAWGRRRGGGGGGGGGRGGITPK